MSVVIASVPRPTSTPAAQHPRHVRDARPRCSCSTAGCGRRRCRSRRAAPISRPSTWTQWAAIVAGPRTPRRYRRSTTRSPCSRIAVLLVRGRLGDVDVEARAELARRPPRRARASRRESVNAACRPNIAARSGVALPPAARDERRRSPRSPRGRPPRRRGRRPRSRGRRARRPRATAAAIASSEPRTACGLAWWSTSVVVPWRTASISRDQRREAAVLEVERRGRAATTGARAPRGRRRRRRLAEAAHERRVEVHVRVDEPGHHELAGGVDHPRRAGRGARRAARSA